jgi:hypothetical protein
MLIDELGNVLNRHRFSHRHDYGFKQQRETTTGSSPWDINQSHPTIIAFNPWHSGCQVGFKLKEVQVPPALFLGIIGFYASLTTPRAGKGTSPGKIDPDVEPLFLEVKL